MHTDSNEQTIPPLKGEMVTARKAVSGHANIHRYKIYLHEKWECGWDWCHLSHLSRATPSQPKALRVGLQQQQFGFSYPSTFKRQLHDTKFKKELGHLCERKHTRSSCVLYTSQNIPRNFRVPLNHLNHWANHWNKNLSCKCIPVS